MRMLPPPNKKLVPLDDEQNVLKWFVAYTYPKAERVVQAKLEKLGLHTYLPLHQVIRSWSDRKKKLIVPLFPNYVFVHASDKKRGTTFAVRELVRYVSFEGKPAIVSDAMINSLKQILCLDSDIGVEEFDQAGLPVIVINGPFAGTEGILVERKGKTRLVVQIRVLQNSISINISIADVAPLSARLIAE